MKIKKYSSLLILMLLFFVSQSQGQSCRTFIKDYSKTSLAEKIMIYKNSFDAADLVVACYASNIDTFYSERKGYYYAVNDNQVLQVFKGIELLNKEYPVRIINSMEYWGNSGPPYIRKVRGEEVIVFLSIYRDSLPDKYKLNSFSFLSRNVAKISPFVGTQNLRFTSGGLVIEDFNQLNSIFEIISKQKITYPYDFYIDHNVNYQEIYNQQKK